MTNGTRFVEIIDNYYSCLSNAPYKPGEVYEIVGDSERMGAGYYVYKTNKGILIDTEDCKFILDKGEE